MPLTTHLSERVQALLADRTGWARFPDDVREWLEMQDYRSRLPAPGELLVETLLAQIEDRPVSNRTIPARLIVRKSSCAQS